MSVALLCVADGRHEYHARSYASLLEYAPKFDQYVFVNDPDHTLGFSGAIRKGWSQVGTDYVLHWEADFLVHRPIPVGEMVSVLEVRPDLVQVALLRQPWSDAEIAAGGVVQQHPDDFDAETVGGHLVLTHRRFVTTNPAVWPRRVIDRGWPDGAHSEGRFALDLFSDPDLRAAYWGGGEEWCEHVGHVRAGKAY